MTVAKIAITVPRPLLAKVRSAVRQGRAASVSAFVSQAVEQRVREDSLAGLLEDLIEQHGDPTREDRAWAKRVLARGRERKK